MIGECELARSAAANIRGAAYEGGMRFVAQASCIFLFKKLPPLREGRDSLVYRRRRPFSRPGDMGHAESNWTKLYRLVNYPLTESIQNIASGVEAC